MDDVDSVTSCESTVSTTIKSSRCREPLEPLIVAALRSAPGKRLLLADIYRYIETHSTDYSSQNHTSTTKEPSWKIHVRHILSVRRDVFRLTTEKDGKRRGRYHELDELAYADKLAAKAQRAINTDRFTVSTRNSSDSVHHRHKSSINGQLTRPLLTHVSLHADLDLIRLSIMRSPGLETE